MPTITPELSIIIPVYNEQDRLPRLLAQIARQRGVELQTVVVDGGSQDDTVRLCKRFMTQHKMNGVCLQSDTSRPMQMNAGIGSANADDLLFLHGDTQIQNDSLLSDALRHLKECRINKGDDNIAGHFPLRFNETKGQHPAGFYFYAAKSSLNRPDCINGDQGLMISKRFLNELGRFDESLPYMEDAKLSSKIFDCGEWVTLPGIVYTSARRFVVEGLKERQLLNSFLCNFNSIGLNAFFTEAQHAYRVQDQTKGLRLRPFLMIIHNLMWQQGGRQAIVWWYKSGAYIASNAWQIAFSFDCRRHRALSDLPNKVKPYQLGRFDRFLAPLFRTKIIKASTGLLTFFWFYSLWLVYR